MNQFNSGKILRHLDRIVEWQTEGVSRPITYELDMTNVCNNKCPFCFGFAKRKETPASQSLDDARDVIRQVRDFGGRGLTFTGGGEPLCNSATPEAVRFARGLGLDVGFITNGTLLTEEIADILVESCTWIRVSVDAGSKETYLKTHGLDGDTFERVVANTAMLVRKKREKGSPVTIGTGFITFPEVTGDMVPFVEISRSIGVDYAQFRPLLKKHHQREVNVAPDEATLREIEACRAMARHGFSVLCSVHKYTLMKDGCTSRGYDRCYGHNFATVIAANRKMYLCCHMRGLEKYCIGDLNENTLEEIWKSDRRRRVYENISFGDCPLLCRCDGFNTILWKLSQQGEHENFL